MVQTKRLMAAAGLTAITVVLLFAVANWNFLFYHTLVELASIVIAMATFMIVWNTKHLAINGVFLLLGCAYFAVALIDLLHTLSYQGMGVLLANGGNIPTQLWIASRYLESFSILGAVLLLGNRIQTSADRVLGLYLIVTFGAVLAIFQGSFPDCFVPGSGLTSFKVISEYIISLTLVVSGYFLYRKRQHLEKVVYSFLLKAIIFTVLAELTFTLYADVTDALNFAGHFFKAFSVYFIYHGLIIGSLKQPYDTLFRELSQELKLRTRAEERVEGLFNVTDVMIVVIDRTGKIVKVNKKCCAILGYPEKELVEKDWFELVIPKRQQATVREFFKGLLEGNAPPPNSYENLVVTKPGEERLIAWNNAFLHDGVGDPQMVICAGEDVTDRRRSEARIRYLSLHDNLTGLFNRAYFESELRRLEAKHCYPFSLIIGDVNGLKLVNDIFGHDEGDKLLCKIADALKHCVGKHGLVARWGGDEFAVLLPNSDLEYAQKLVGSIHDHCSTVGNKDYPLSVALGAGVRMDSQKSIHELIRDTEDKMYRAKYMESRSVRNAIISSLERILHEKSHETEEHALRMQRHCLEFGQKLDLSGSVMDELVLLAGLHDIGKIAIPESIIQKPEALTCEEWLIIKEHPQIGYRIALATPELAPIADGILYHHEWWDGSGYPNGLKGEQIPLISRIVAIIDAYDVLTNGRSYKAAVTPESAIREIRRCAHTQFDPQLVDLFGEIMQEIMEIAN